MPSDFFIIPFEIREQIFIEFFGRFRLPIRPFTAAVQQRDGGHPSLRIPSSATDLLICNSAINEEASEVLYGRIRYVFTDQEQVNFK